VALHSAFNSTSGQGGTQPLDCTLHPVRRVLHLRQYIPDVVCIPVHPGCTSGYGDWWAGMLAGACSGLYAHFSAPAGRGKESQQRAKTPAEVGGAQHIGIVGCFTKVLSP
jgi:hypothetical protein